MPVESESLQFLGPAWFAEMEATLKRVFGEHADELAGVEFSICEVFHGVPPHGDVRAWNARFSGGDVDFALGEREAGHRIRVSHAVVLPFAMAVYGRNSAAENERLAAYRQKHVARGDWESVDGLAHTPPLVTALLREVHDQVALRCVWPESQRGLA